jgi:WD40 repeat protein
VRHSVAAIVLALSAVGIVTGDPPGVRFDRDGDRLPDGAIARLGSRRFRDPGAERLYVWDTGKVVACFDGPTVRWWDLETGRYLRGWAAPKDGRTWFGPWFSPDGRVAAYQSDRTLEVWDAWSNRRLRTIPLGEAQWIAAAITPGGRSVAVGTGDGEDKNCRVRVIDLASGDVRLDITLDLAPSTLDFAIGGRLLIVRTLRETAVAWDVDRQVISWQLESCDKLVFDRGGHWFYTKVGDGKLFFGNALTGKPLTGTTKVRADAPLQEVQDLSPDGRHLLAYGVDGFLWDRRRSHEFNRKHQLLTDGYVPGLLMGAFLRDGRQAAAAYAGRLHVFDLATRTRLTPDLPDWGQPGKVYVAGWSADGARVITWARVFHKDQQIWEALAWDPATGRIVGKAPKARLDPYGLYVRSVAEDASRPLARDAAGHWIPSSFVTLPDGALIAAGQPPGWQPQEPPEPSSGPKGCRLGKPDPNWWEENPSVVEACTGRALVTIPVRHARHLALSPDHRLLAVGEPDGVHLYDVLTGRERLIREIPTYPRADPTERAEEGLSFSPDGKRLAVVERGGTVLVFDVAIRRERLELGDGEVDRLWTDLGSPDPKVGWAALFRLADRPAEAMKMFGERLTPIRVPTETTNLIDQLDLATFRAREAASRRLLDLGDAVRPAVAKAMTAATDPEARGRLESITASLADRRPPQPVDLRRLRALVVLEKIGSPEARTKVQELAGGMDGVRVTVAAKAALKRMSGRE